MNTLKKNSEFYSKLFSLVLPIAFQQFMLAAVNASDALMLGLLDQDSLSAVSLAGQVQFVFNLFLAAITIGASMLAAQYWGKGDRDAVERILALVLKITTPVSLAVFLAAQLCPGLLMRIFTRDEVLIAGGVRYLQVVGLSYLMTGISQIFLCILKNSGQAMKSTVISSFSVVLNIFLNAVFIFGFWIFPEMGIAGAALATVIAKAAELLWLFAESCREGRIHLRMRYVIHTDPLLRKDFWKYTTPVLANEMVWGCGFTMYSVIMGHLGSDAVAANSIANIVKNLIACFCSGIGNGGGILVGNELGQGNLEKARSYGGRLCRISIVSGIISGLVLLALSPLILSVSNLSDVSAGYLRGMLLICSYYMIGRAVNATTIAGIFCAGGDSRFGLLCDTVVMWVIAVPLGLISAFVLNLPVLAVYFVISLDEMVKLPAVYRHYKKYAWVKDLTR
ncbi:MAG TPA: MATE family efflux transporter [Candidatus Pullilachnospira stercoravium]|uniref:MATE family efflux transporter n=1 Tax=Candidatus Pullilachnospira stercoravium TaxID=2840913 RepID=A0A9D1NVW0_9FIRM|nr:MATE family efflux transporter [Candidatus Pullilachnospira stercoravium]